MSRTMFAIAFAGLIFTAASGTAHAAPILPLSATATASLDNLTDVQRRCWRDRWGRLHCRRAPAPGWGAPGWGPGWGAPGWGAPGWGGRNCWRDRWGQLQCRW
jgi:hypothetical protein